MEEPRENTTGRSAGGEDAAGRGAEDGDTTGPQGAQPGRFGPPPQYSPPYPPPGSAPQSPPQAQPLPLPGPQAPPSPSPANPYAVPVPPPLPPMPTRAPDAGPGLGPLRPLTVALLNLTGLGLGYLLVRRWLLAGVCWAATIALLVVALPADVDGVPGGLLIGYGALLLLAAAHGAYSAARDRRPWPLRAPLAVALAVALLAVPAGGAYAYENARDEAVERMLLDRLHTADRIVAGLKGAAFDRGTAKARYEKALRVYRGLADDHPGSRAADRLPESLGAYYESVAAPYAAKQYCDAVTPLQHLRTVPDTFAKDRLGSLATWPDDRLATSLYECGIAGLGRTAGAGTLGTLLRTFPDSGQAAKVEPALRAAITSREAALKGSAPCTAVGELRAIGTTADALPAGKVDGEALRGAADRVVESGVYACGVDEFGDGRFTEAAATLNGFAKDYPANKRHDRAKDIAVAAEIAAERPSAGRRLPPSRPGGGGKVDLVIANLGPGELEVLYTGPTTGTVKLKACASCGIYPTKTAGDKACRAGVSKYPKTTLRLPVGDYHFLYKRSTVRNRADGATLNTAYRYTDCSFVTRGAAGLGLT